MIIVELDPAEVAELIGELQAAQARPGGQVLIAIDGPPQEAAPALKVRINWGVWSRPLGHPEVR